MDFAAPSLAVLISALRGPTMNNEMRRFLQALSNRDGPVPVQEIGIGCTARQSVARQDARRLGYTHFQPTTRSWTISTLGRMALSEIDDTRAA